MTAAAATKLSDLLRWSGVPAPAVEGPDPEVRGVCLDSRRIAPGDLFCAIRGFDTDGLRFVPQAVERGAVGVVSDSPRPGPVDSRVAWVRVDDPRVAAGRLSRECFRRPDEALQLVGITGTNGKTTVVSMVEAMARAAGRSAGRIGTMGHAFGNVVQPGVRTTPEAPDFYRLLAEMRDSSIDLVAVEVSSHALALSRVEGARFAVAAFLNLSRDHLDFHGDEAGYFEAKARLFDGLEADAHAVLPADSPFGETLRRRTRASALTFGRARGAAVRLRDEHHGLDGSSAILDTPSGSLPIRSFLLGRFNLDNVAAAAACALALGLPPESIPAGVLSVQRIPGRMERVDLGQPFSVVVDYAHTEDALRNLLAWARGIASGRLSVVFGCGGGRDAGKRYSMGRAAAELADRIYVTSDNPRDEDSLTILEEIRRGVASVDGGLERCEVIDSRDRAIRIALTTARDGDVVLLAGKGHETTQTIGKRTEPFDDRIVAAAALSSLGWNGVKSAGA